ncbi:MAG: PKD domain-containing protein [Algibacter sp.]
MIYKSIKKFNKSIFLLFFAFLTLASCYDSGYEEFVPPTGNVNNIQPNTLFTTTTNAADNLSVVFRSFSTDAVSYLWDFGDGNTSTEANPDYTYSEGGVYTVTLTTKSSDGLEAVDSSDVAPVFVDFDFTIIDSEVTFENLTSGANKLVWDFGDGETLEWNSSEDTEEDPDFNPVYIYSAAGTFEVTLTVTNFLGVEVTVNKNIEGLVLSTVPQFSFVVDGFDVEFTDESINAVSYLWDFGDGNTSDLQNPTHTYSENNEYEVMLTTQNSAGVSKSISKNVIAGIVTIFADDPVLINWEFTKLPKISGSDCGCSAWINNDLGTDGESSGGNGGSDNLVKFDNDENDAVYQEFAVVQNADYTVKIVAAFKELTGGSFPSMLELRILAGSGYSAGYAPTYYTETTEFPKTGWGYSSITQVETAGNNLMLETLSNPNDTGYLTYEFTFNAGSNDSVAFFMRGIGGDGTPSDDKFSLPYNNGDEEIRVDNVIIESVNKK